MSVRFTFKTPACRACRDCTVGSLDDARICGACVPMLGGVAPSYLSAAALVLRFIVEMRDYGISTDGYVFECHEVG